MKPKIVRTWNWLTGHPVAFINLVLALIAIVFFTYLMTKPIDVLENWNVKTTRETYTPGGTLEFVSSSEKLIPAEGETSRIFDCDAVGNQSAREIQLPSVPANRPPGTIAPRENSITVPGVASFNGLPRNCRLVFNICYQDVILWRDHCESARTNDFSVKEEELDAAGIREQIKELNERIRQLESQLIAYESSRTQSTASVAQQPAANRPSTVIVVPQPSAAPQPTPSPSPSPSPSPVPAASPRPCVIGLLSLCLIGAR